MSSCILTLCLANLYVEAAVGYVAPVPSPPPARVWHFDANYHANPKGRFAIGHEWNPDPKIRVSLDVRHESWLGTLKDFGENSVWASVRYRPWAQ